MLSQTKRTQQAQKLVETAVEKHGEMKNRKCRPPLNQLILSLLYHLTSVRRATRALNELKNAFVDWNEVRISHPREVAGAMSTADWAEEAGEQIVWLLRELYDVHNRADLDFLSELTVAEARSCLRGLPMVDRTLADEVLLMSLEAPVLPCPDATVRMCFRLGLIENDRNTLKNQRALQKLFDPEHYVPLYLYFCDMAETACMPDVPECEECSMSDGCPSRN